MRLKFPKVGYEVNVYYKGELDYCIYNRTFYSQKDVNDFLEPFDKDKFDVSVTLIGETFTW